VDKWIRASLEGKDRAENVHRQDDKTAPSAEAESRKTTGTDQKRKGPIDIEKAMKEYEVDKVFLKELLDGFIHNVRKQLKDIEKAIAAGDAEKVRREAHSIKGGAANICAEELSKLALEMEMLGKSGNVDTGRDLLGSMEREFTRLEEFDKELQTD